MRKWIVPHPEKQGLKLQPAWDKPSDAFCEAPEHFTDEMEPFFKLSEITLNDGHKSHTVDLDSTYFDYVKNRDEAIKQRAQAQHANVARAMTKHKMRVIHNQLNPFQRFCYSILGPRAHKPGKLTPVVKVLFGKNHGLILGGSYDF